MNIMGILVISFLKIRNANCLGWNISIEGWVGGWVGDIKSLMWEGCLLELHRLMCDISHF